MTVEASVEDIISKVLGKVGEQGIQVTETARQSQPAPKQSAPKSSVQKRTNAMTEFVGTAMGDTIGLVIANVDSELLSIMNLEKKYRSIGIIGARTGAGPHIMAADEAVKATNTEVIKIELARDTKGGAGHGSLIMFGGNDVSDVRRAVEVALGDLERTFGDVYANDAGHIELQYSARASHALETAFGAPLGRACGVIVGAPAAIGVLMADTAVKSANVETVAFSSPGNGTSYSNEVILVVSGDAGAVRQAVSSASATGRALLETMAGPAPSASVPYI